MCLSVCLSHNSTAVNLVHLRLVTQCTCLSQNSGDWGITGARFWKVPPKSTVTTVDFRDRARSRVLAFGRCRQNQPSPRLISEIGPPKSTVTTVDFRDRARSWVLAFVLEGFTEINRQHCFTQQRKNVHQPWPLAAYLRCEL